MKSIPNIQIKDVKTGGRIIRNITHPYFKESNFTASKDQPTFHAKVFQFISIADQNNSILDIFTQFFPSPFQHNSNRQFNLPFQFCLTLYIFRERFYPNSIKKTESSNEYFIAALGQNFSHSARKQLQAPFLALLDQIASQWHSQEILMKEKGYSQKKTILLQYFTSKINHICEHSNELAFLVPQRFKNNKDELVNYIRINLQMLQKVEWFKIKQRHARISNFLSLHKDYYDIFLVNKHGWSRDQNMNYGLDVVQIKNRPIIISLQNYISLRQDSSQYYRQGKVLVEELYRLLIEYYESIKDRSGRHLHYKHLHPKYVLYDQSTLKMELSHYPLIVQALGMQEQPLSVEARVVHQPTPKLQSQSCLTPIQIQQKNLYNDPYYGQTWWFQKQVSKMNQTWHQRQHRALMENQSLFWKFIHTVHYIYYGKFYNDKIKSRKDYEHSIVNLKKEIEQNPSKVLSMVNVDVQVPQKLQCRFEQLQSLLCIKGQKDSFLQQFGITKIKLQLNFYCQIKEQLRIIFQENYAVLTTTNAKLYFLVVFQQVLMGLFYDLAFFEMDAKKFGSSLSLIMKDRQIKAQITTRIQMFKNKCSDYLAREQQNVNKKFLREEKGKEWLQRANVLINKYKKFSQQKEAVNVTNTNVKQCMKNQINKVKALISQFTSTYKQILTTLQLKESINNEPLQSIKNKYLFRKTVALGRCFIAKQAQWGKYQVLLKRLNTFSEDQDKSQNETFLKYSNLIEQIAIFEQILTQDNKN